MKESIQYSVFSIQTLMKASIQCSVFSIQSRRGKNADRDILNTEH